ncbi:MAG: hypothetical protein AAF581_15875 [Planctomycetota bacterium]
MFGAIGRYMRALWYLVTGRIDSARKELSKNPHVVQATFDQIIRDKTNSIQRYKEAVASMIAQEEKKLHTVKNLSEEVNKLERLKEGAAAKAKEVVQRLQASGKSMDEIKGDLEYQKCLSAFNDFNSTEAEKNRRIAELEQDIAELGENIGGHKIQLQQLLRDVEKLKEEASATVADIITASEEEKIADMLAGISADSSSKQLQEMRDLRQQQKAEARVSRELAGTDTKRQEAEFLDYASKSVSSDEFDQLIGLADQADKGADGDLPESTKLPE